MIPYPPIGRHAVVGDRRSAALIAADGTVDWLCLPRYDSPPVFGALLDADRGGYFRLGPTRREFGDQDYRENLPVVSTRWILSDGVLEATDVMAMPEDTRPSGHEDDRVLMRRLRCSSGQVDVSIDLCLPRGADRSVSMHSDARGVQIQIDALRLRLWSNHPLRPASSRVRQEIRLTDGDVLWTVLTADSDANWTADRAERLFDDTRDYWRGWGTSLTYDGYHTDQVRHSAMLIHLLGYAPEGSLVAAPTTSLPERIGGDRNYDYRYAWVRDASLSLAIMAMLGDTATAKRYLDWLATLGSSTSMPLQVVYGVDGRTDLRQIDQADLYGYQGSRPVRVGNHAYTQRQPDSFGFLADCALIYLEHGGVWDEPHWVMIRRAAEYVAATWKEPDNGIWELSRAERYVSSALMDWVTLDRAIKIEQKLGLGERAERWRATRDQIRDELLARGWSDKLQSFRQRFDVDSLDAASLLIPLMGFLPASDPRVASTLRAIERELVIDDMVYRFDPRDTIGPESLPLGQFEGAFLPCTFWLAAVHAQAGAVERARALLEKVEDQAGDLGIFAEEIDARSGQFLGNTPLLFSHAEYIRAIDEINKALPLRMARRALGKIDEEVKDAIQRLENLTEQEAT